MIDPALCLKADTPLTIVRTVPAQAPDLVAHVAVGEVEAGEHDGLQLGLLHHAAVHAVTNLPHKHLLST